MNSRLEPHHLSLAEDNVLILQNLVNVVKVLRRGCFRFILLGGALRLLWLFNNNFIGLNLFHRFLLSLPTFGRLALIGLGFARLSTFGGHHRGLKDTRC